MFKDQELLSFAVKFEIPAPKIGKDGVVEFTKDHYVHPNCIKGRSQ